MLRTVRFVVPTPGGDALNSSLDSSRVGIVTEAYGIIARIRATRMVETLIVDESRFCMITTARR